MILFFEGGEGKLQVSHSLVCKGPLKLNNKDPSTMFVDVVLMSLLLNLPTGKC